MVSLAILVLGGAFAYGVVAQRDDLPPLPQLTAAYDALVSLGEGDLADHPRRHHLQPSRGQGEGVTVNLAPEDDALVLLAGFFDEENQVRLVRRDGTVVRTWSLDYFEHFPDPEVRPCALASPLRVDTHGVHATPRGDVVLNYEYCGTVKLDQCGRLAWSIDRQTHHSLVPAEGGGYWLLGREQWPASERPDRFPMLSNQAPDEIILEDTILRVSEDGELIDEISIPELMLNNGLEAVLTASGGSSFRLNDRADAWELVHANKVTELPSGLAASYPLFAAGDLAVSLRGRNLVMVVDPVTQDVKWHQIGPWVRQHDPEFREDGRISIFNNNTYITTYVDDQTDLEAPFTTNIIAVDPETGDTDVVFGQAPGQQMLSVLRGDHEPLGDDAMLIAEFDAGRVLQVDPDGRVVWEYVNRYDDGFVGEITNAAIYPTDYFEVEWQDCAP